MKRILFSLLFLFCIKIACSQTGEQQKTRILFIFDASKSMFGHFGGKPKIDIAQRLLSDAVDSLKGIPNVELALRVYGNRSPITAGNQDCEDTHLEVPFGPDNTPQIKTILKTTYPNGTTPIARSLEATINDFTPCTNCKNVVVLITDGVEACDGDPCAISRALMTNGIFLKPFVIGLGVLDEYKRHFYCIGNFYDAKDESSFKTVLGLVLNEALNSTSVQVNLLDVNGDALETNVNMSFYNSATGELKYNYYHTMNFQHLPDTISIDPSINYDITVHTLPKVKLQNVAIKPGQHNIIPIETPQGSIALQLSEGKMRELNFIVKEEGDCEVINVQSFKDEVKYLVGTYDIEILTLPRIKMTVDVAQSETIVIGIPAPGLATFNVKGKGFGSVYQKINGKLELVYSFVPESLSNRLELQPGDYLFVHRGKNVNRSFYTVEKEFTIKSGKSTIVQL